MSIQGHRVEAEWVPAAKVAEVQKAGCVVRTLGGHAVAVFWHGGEAYAVDNRCPHMGFPLHRGTVDDGILTCHWHHARFDLATGGTFDTFADDVGCFPVQVRDGEVFVDVAQRGDLREHQRRRLREALETNTSLVIGKAVLYLLDAGDDAHEPFRIGLDFGVRNRAAGWGQGLTMHTCFMNLLPHLAAGDRPRALYHGLSAVARETMGSPPRFMLRPLPGSTSGFTQIKRWFRRFVEVRDEEGAERCILTALEAGAGPDEMSDMLFAAATDHRYIDIGHVADFTNKAIEALQAIGWEHAGPVLTSLVPGFARAARMEESNAWRNPVDLVALLEKAFEQVPSVLDGPRNARGLDPVVLSDALLADDPHGSVAAVLDALRSGASIADVAGAVAYAAALRIAHFHTSNEFGDWDTTLHTFSFANAIHQAARRVPSPQIVRGILDGAMSVYLDRFLNTPPAPLPAAQAATQSPESLLGDLSDACDRQQQVNQAGALVARYLDSGGSHEPLLGTLGKLLLREDRDFHTIQTIEAAFAQHRILGGGTAGRNVLVAAARYLAAHAPTVRGQGQTYQIAQRLHRGERIYEEA